MKQILLLTGENEVLKNEYLTKILDKFTKDQINYFHLDQIEIDKLFSEFQTFDMFSKKRVFVLKNYDNATDNFKRELKKVLINIPKMNNEDSFIILCSEKIIEESYVDVIEFKRFYRDDIIEYIISRLKELKISYEEGIPEYITDLACENLDIIIQMIEIIKNYESGSKISFEDIDKLFEREKGSGIFDLIDGIFTKDIKKAYVALNDLREQNESVISINYMINRTTRLMWTYLVDRKKSALNIKPYEQKKLEFYSKNVDLRFISKVFSLVSSLEIIAKTMTVDFAFIEIEKFILTM